MKYILIIPDGMGDVPVKSLGYKTPLEAAQTPNMDFFSSRGVVGLANNIPRGFIPGTDIGSMSVFGYNPKVYFTGRGPLEAAVHGIRLGAKDLAFRCNLVTLQGKILTDFSAGHIELLKARKIINEFNKVVKKKFGSRVCFYAGKGTGYRHLAVLKGASPNLSKIKCAPPHDIMGQPYEKYLPKGKDSSILNDLMALSRDFLKSQKAANSIWLWGQGFPPKFPSFLKKYGFTGGVITAVDLLKGIAIHAGLKVIRVPGVTGYFDTNYLGKARYAVNSLKRDDFVVIHVESTDEAGHIGDPKLKIKAIEDVDNFILGTLRNELEQFKEYKIMLLPDHFTCVSTRTHSSDPVPFFMYSNQNKKKGPDKFCEISARKTGIRVRQGHQLMDYFVKGRFD